MHEWEQIENASRRKLTEITYFMRMAIPFEFGSPTKSTAVPDGPDWLHEIKYDVSPPAGAMITRGGLTGTCR